MKRKGAPLRPGAVDTSGTDGTNNEKLPAVNTPTNAALSNPSEGPRQVTFAAPSGGNNATSTGSNSNGNGATKPSPPSQPPQASTTARGAASSPRVRANTTTLSGNDAERKRKVIRNVPLLKQLVKEQLCSEDELVDAFEMVSFADGDYIYCQGQTERDMFFIEEGRVVITQRRGTTGISRLVARRRSAIDVELEVQVATHQEFEYFGEMALLQCSARKSNAVAQGNVVCMKLSGDDYQELLQPVMQLLLYRHQLRAHNVLEKNRLFKEFSPQQRQYLINHCQLVRFEDGEYLCTQGEVEDRYYILVEGEAKVVFEENLPEPPTRSRAGSVVAVPPSSPSDASPQDPSTPSQPAAPSSSSSSESAADDSVEIVKRGGVLGGLVRSSVVAQKNLYQGFGEMGLLEKARTAHVIAVGYALCIEISRKTYVGAAQLMNSTIDNDAESLLATTLIEEWNLALNARNLHLSNPRVAHYLVTFIKKFKAAYNQKFVGKTMYLDFFRRLHQEPHLADEFVAIASRIAWDSPSSSLSIIRSETRRILTLPPSMRTAADMSFVGRMIEHTPFLDKFEMPPNVDKPKVARHLGKFMEFVNILKDQYLFRQGKIESKAYMILRGKINIVNEDVNSANTMKHHEVIATLSAGDSFGELSLVTRLQRSATAMAPCDTDLLVLDRDHLAMLSAALPGVSVRHVMVERAEFLAKLSFFKGSDFGQCIRVAHDMQEASYEPRHIFLKEPAHQRTLYIVKSGEIAVFLKRSMPSKAQWTSGQESKQALVRVATIGPQEFFGVAIVHANFGSANTTTAAPSSPSNHNPPSSSVPNGQHPPNQQQNQQHSVFDFSSTVFMSTTRVVVLELSERGWRRLSPTSLHIIRNALLERNRWNLEVVNKHKDPTYYHIDRPWQLLVRGATATTTGKPEERFTSQLARHLKNKKVVHSSYAHFFPDESQVSTDPDDGNPKASSTRSATPPSSPLHQIRAHKANLPQTVLEWEKNRSMGLGGSFVSPSTQPTFALSPSPRRPLVRVPPVAQAAIAAAAVSAQMIAAATKHVKQIDQQDTEEDAYAFMWKTPPRNAHW